MQFIEIACTREFFKDAKLPNFGVIEKLTRAYFQIALEIILLPVINMYIDDFQEFS